MLHWPVVKGRTQAGFDHQPYALPGDLPAGVVAKAAVRQSALCPAAEGEAKTSVFVRHIQAGSLDAAAVDPCLDGCLFASGFK